MAQYTQINPDALVTALTPINNSLGGKQDKTDNTLATTDKTISGAINEINTKVGNLTGALTWKGKFDTLPAVTDYEAGNVVGVGNKEYVLTVTGSTKAWEELGDEGSYLLKSVAEETYLKKAAGEVKSTNLANNAVTKEKLSTDVQSSLDKANNSLQKGNVAAPTSDTDAVNKSYVDGKIENLITNDDSLNLNVPIIIYTSTDDDSIAANKASISFYLNFWEKYTSRITDTTFGDTNIRRPSNICFIPTILSVSKSNNRALGTGIIFGISGVPDISYYHGIFRATSMSDSTHNGSYKIVSINANTGKLESASQLISANISYSKFNTTAKDIFGAINEVNTLAKSKGNGTITGVRMNGVSKGTSGVVDLGTVITAHQDISGKVDKTTLLNTLMVVDLTSDDITVRKAALDDFKAKWLALGNTDLNGARFIANGYFNLPSPPENNVIMTYVENGLVATGYIGIAITTYNSIIGAYRVNIALDGTMSSNAIKDLETTDAFQHFAWGEVPTTYLKITDAESTYAKKTSIPTVNDPKVSIKMNGAEKGSFTLNQASAGEVDLGTVLTEHQDISGKQDKLISGTNIKTINGESVLGSGDITISSGASSSAYPEVNHGTGDTTFTLTPNTFHVWDEVTSLTLNFGSGISGMANEYLFQFTSGSTATSLTLPDDIKWANDNVPTIGANMIYQVSVLRGLASVLEFNNAIVFPIIGDTGGNANEEYAKVYEYFVSTYNLTSVSDNPSDGVIITETLICNNTYFGGPVLKVSLSGTRLLLWTQKAINGLTVPTINNLGVYYNHTWD